MTSSVYFNCSLATVAELPRARYQQDRGSAGVTRQPPSPHSFHTARISSLAGNDLRTRDCRSRWGGSGGHQYPNPLSPQPHLIHRASARDWRQLPYSSTATPVEQKLTHEHTDDPIAYVSKCRYNRSHCVTMETLNPPPWPTAKWALGKPNKTQQLFSRTGAAE